MLSVIQYHVTLQPFPVKKDFSEVYLIGLQGKILNSVKLNIYEGSIVTTQGSFIVRLLANVIIYSEFITKLVLI